MGMRGYKGWLGSQVHTSLDIADLDGDGLVDLLMGSSIGTLTFHANTGSASAPAWGAGAYLVDDDSGEAILVGQTSIPHLYDLDADGDLDLLLGSESGGIVTVFDNVWDGTGAPRFADAGQLQVDGADYQVPKDPCEEVDFFTQDYTASVEAVDWDADGDDDLLVGGYITGYVFFLENTAGAGNPPVFTDAGWLEDADGEPLDTQWGADPAAVDVDGDGDLDLLSGTYGPYLDDTSRAEFPWIWFWENTAGPGVTPVLTSSTLPLSDDLPITRGALARIDAADIDDDGDIDLLYASDGRVRVLENDGGTFSFDDGLSRAWTPTTFNIATQAVDLDADGDLDLSKGGGSGISIAWNTDDTLNPHPYEGGSTLEAGGVVMNIEFAWGDDTSFPHWYDTDGDGDYDVVVGAADGTLQHYENIGTATDLELDTAQQLYLEDGEPVHVGLGIEDDGDFGSHSGDRAKPAVGDLDGDGIWDLMVGAADGSVTMFLNEGTATEPVFAAGEAWHTYAADSRAMVELVDWDGDGDLDLWLAQAGGLWLVDNTGSASAPQFSTSASDWRSVELPLPYYPNPRAVDYNGDGDLDLVMSTSYAYVYVADGTWLDNDSTALEARPASIEHYDGASTSLSDVTSFDYDGSVPLNYAWPPFTVHSGSGGSSDGDVLTLVEGDAALLGTLFSADGGWGWESVGPGTEVAVSAKVLEVTAPNTDAISFSVSDGTHNFHLRLDEAGTSWYSAAGGLALDTTDDFHTYRLAIGDGVVSLCIDDDPTLLEEEVPSAFTYARQAFWVGDDGSGTGGTVQIDWMAWTTEGDGDPCTAG